jgi:2-oxoglutarate dehydrogenase E1 component
MPNNKGGQGQSPHTPNQILEATSFLYGANAPFIEGLEARYAEDPNSVGTEWRSFFASLGERHADESGASGPSWRRPDWPIPENGDWTNALTTDWVRSEIEIGGKIRAKAAEGGIALTQEAVRAAALDSIRALMLIRAYRIRGHLMADLDPLRLEPVAHHPELDPASYGFTAADLDRPIFINKVLGLETSSMRHILEIVRRTYCGTFGVEFMHISDPEQKAWIQERIEGPDKEISFTPEGKRAIFQKLVEAEGFEKFLQIKYTGTKRFGLDGAESLIPAMEQIIKRGGHLGVREIVLGMPHRGRLNVLANVLAKPYRAIFHEFKGGSSAPDDVEGSGDVKYHLGASSDRAFDGNQVHLSLTANPSHLEAVNPVVLGKVRAKQAQLGDVTRRIVLPVLLHGDAAFAGQGVIAECFGLSGLKGHRSGGTIHLIVNNQIGFTTAPRFSRSSPYPSDIALMVQAPIFHVNGDDPEAVVFATKIATEFRQKFSKDVVIDMFCYRRHGHNEGDEPSFTQPVMYKAIKTHKTTLEIYGEKLSAEGHLSKEAAEQTKSEFHARLEVEFKAGDTYRPNKADWLDGRWANIARPTDDDRRGATAVEIGVLKKVGRALTAVPPNLKIHRTLERILKAKEDMFSSGEGFDWATAEALAFGTLLLEGHPVRLSGQDSVRGTFSQRHSQFVDQETENRYTPLNHIVDKQPAEYEAVDSMLSEFAVLGFEYGYSLSEPNALVLWEAQFGDFANGAQIMIDQFITSGEAKWLRMSGLVLLLPHGYEGQGPEHSSARLERFLQMCAQDNIQVANCTTPANYFHVLRRQVRRNFRKPLVLMTPKSLLRHKSCVSALAEMSGESSFHRVLHDGAEMRPGSGVRLKPDSLIRRVVLCSGKVYYDLFEEREARGMDDVQILRIEQLHPFPAKSVLEFLRRFPQAEIVWCQEEPKNMGAGNFVDPYLEWVLNQLGRPAGHARYAGRPAAAATATGLMTKHLKELKTLLDEALATE